MYSSSSRHSVDECRRRESQRGEDWQWEEEGERMRGRETEWKTDGCVLFWHLKRINQKPCDLCQCFPSNSHIIASLHEHGNVLICVWKLNWTTQPHYNFPMIHLWVWHLMTDWRHRFRVFPLRWMASEITLLCLYTIVMFWLLIQPLINIIVTNTVTLLFLHYEIYYYNLWILGCFCSVFTPFTVFTGLWHSQYMYRHGILYIIFRIS